MAAKRITKSAINWAQLAERVPPNQRSNFLAFKSKSDGYLKRVMSMPEEAPKIDWSTYKAKIPVAGMVDNFKKSYQEVKIPFPVDNVTQQIDAQEKLVKTEVVEFKKLSDARIKQYEEQLSHLNSLIPFDQMTMEDFRDAYPDLALDPINRPTYWPHDAEEQTDWRDKDHPYHKLVTEQQH